MTDFTAKMHQIRFRFRLGLRPTPRWGSLQRSARPPSWIWGALLLREGKESGGEGKEGEGMGGEEREGRRGKRVMSPPPVFGGSLRLWQYRPGSEAACKSSGVLVHQFPLRNVLVEQFLPRDVYA